MRRLICFASLCLLLCSCSSTRKVVTTDYVHDTITVVRQDSIIITPHVDSVSLAVPQESQSVTTTDTTVTAETSLYKATARWSGGKLSLQLRAKEGAKVDGAVSHADTTRISRSSSRRASARQSNTVKTQYVYKMIWWQKILMWIGVACIVGGAISIGICMKK